MVDFNKINSNILAFNDYGIFPNNTKWENCISRQKNYQSKLEIRTPFEKDYNKVIFSLGYRRLKHKTQVFFNPESDHISTRSEHVAIVECVAYTIAKFLGLNVELTRAISIAHDIGHAPFGHEGEKILNDISTKYLEKPFWHERNGLEILDNILLLKDEDNNYKNLNLTYALRDGVISHCGEIDENSIKPRDNFFDLQNYKYPNQYMPYTYEGCVVKIADKIAYLGRDIEDAISLGILDENISELYNILGLKIGKDHINNSSMINSFILDLCENSNPVDGLCFSDSMFNTINKIKKYNYDNIYFSPKVRSSRKYFRLIIETIFDFLFSLYESSKTIEHIESVENKFPIILNSFKQYLFRYFKDLRNEEIYKNKALFKINHKSDYIQAIIYYISGMTDNFAIKIYNEIVSFGFIGDK